jgi:hypothetical protein
LFPIPEIFQKISKKFTELNVLFVTKYSFVKKNPTLRQFQTERVVGIQQLFNLKYQISNLTPQDWDYGKFSVSLIT